MRDDMRGAYYETVDAIKDALRNTSRSSLPVGVVIACVDFDSSVTRTVINEMIEVGDLKQYDNGDIALNS